VRAGGGVAVKRSSALKRRRPFRSRGPTRSGRRSKYRTRLRSTDYMLGVKELPCAALIVPGHVCDGPIEADHAGRRGVGRKALDGTVIPMCRLAHRQRESFSGPFREWDQAAMRAFLDGRILQTRRMMWGRGFAVPELDEGLTEPVSVGYTVLPPIDVGEFGVIVPPRELPPDVREVGDIDVRYPDAAPLPVAYVVTEGDKDR
jgi:hypothetical protein